MAKKYPNVIQVCTDDVERENLRRLAAARNESESAIARSFIRKGLEACQHEIKEYSSLEELKENLVAEGLIEAHDFERFVALTRRYRSAFTKDAANG